MVNYDNSFLKYPFNQRIVVSLTDSHTLIIFDHELHELDEFFLRQGILFELHELFLPSRRSLFV